MKYLRNRDTYKNSNNSSGKKNNNIANMRKPLYKHISFLLLFCLLTLCLIGCNPNKNGFSKTGIYFDTVITVTLYEKDSEELIDSCFELAEKYENMLSRTKEGSDIYKINNANGQFVEVNQETVDLINKALYYQKLSNGAFNPLIGTISSEWDFKSDNPAPPASELISQLLNTMNQSKIDIDGNMVRVVTIANLDSNEMPEYDTGLGSDTGLDSDTSVDSDISVDSSAKIDLGGIAKGYIADKMKDYLLSEGVTSAVINLGGNVMCIGSKPDGSPYRIGIQKPFSADGEVISSVELRNQTMVTSGCYQRYFEYNDTLYHHILDTNTGYPVKSDLNSVTIITDSSANADALSTICYIYGYEKSKEFLSNIDNVKAVYVDLNNAILE